MGWGSSLEDWQFSSIILFEQFSDDVIPKLDLSLLRDCNPPSSQCLELRGHAVAKTPTGMARALLCAFLLHPSFKIFYHTFHRTAVLDHRISVC